MVFFLFSLNLSKVGRCQIEIGALYMSEDDSDQEA